jgi:limonene-1,2-epoxide hydrolase
MSAVGDSSNAERVVRQFMATCTQAWPTGDTTSLGRFFSEDAEYHNGPLKPVKGQDAIVASLTEMMALGGEVEADIRHLVADGPVVMTERVDYVRLGDKLASLRIAGVFEVDGGVITAWRDYFDGNEFGAQLQA